MARTPAQYRAASLARGGSGRGTSIRGTGRDVRLGQATLRARGSGIAAFGRCNGSPRHGSSADSTDGMLHNIVNDLFLMPRVMRATGRRAVPVVVRAVRDVDLHDRRRDDASLRYYGSLTSAAFNEGANWVGVLFAAYNGFAALAALFIPTLAARLGRRRAHLVGLWCGALGLDLDTPHRRSAMAARCR